MATGIYLVDNSPRIQQFRCPRRRKPSGIIGVHTAESFPDETGPDTGAENVADFIRRRTNHGSYHLLADSDSIIQLVRFECVAYHIGTHGLNEHTIGISAATQAAKWNSVGKQWRQATVKNMARGAVRAARWLKEKHGITVPARRLTLAQALNGQRGFLAHGDADPARRTDPGRNFPWSLFLGTYADLMRGGPAPTPPEDDMPTPADLWDHQLDDPVTGKKQTAHTLLRNARRDAHDAPEDAWNVEIDDPVTGKKLTAHAVLRNARRDAHNALVLLRTQADPAAFAAELAPLLRTEPQENIEAALREVLGSLDEPDAPE